MIRVIAYTATLFFISLFISAAEVTYAASLKLSPETGVYTAGKTFTASILINTSGQSVNAADGQMLFNPKELQVVGVSRSGSIFSLWTEEPAYSNSAGTVSFGGGSPTGYKGSSGNIVSITFKALAAGTPKVKFSSGSILAADGLGTNILTSMNGGSYTIVAQADSPEPEYIAPANTPKAPHVESITHPDQTIWYKAKTAELTWAVPNDVVAIRMLLDTNPGSVPTNVYDEPLKKKMLDNLDEGVSYFHVQFKNAQGWGRITHYKLSIDSVAPQDFTISKKEDAPVGTTILQFNLSDTSPTITYEIGVDGGDNQIFEDKKGEKMYTVEGLMPGEHTVIVHAKDLAGNQSTATHTFVVEAIQKPKFIDVPERVGIDVVPALKGTSLPNTHVHVTVMRVSDGVIIEGVTEGFTAEHFNIQVDDSGNFTYVPAGSFAPGVYEITAIARDATGRLSESSDPIRLIAEEPGYVRLGTTAINILSVFVPLSALVLLLCFGIWYLWHRLMCWRTSVLRETKEAEISINHEFATILKSVHEKIDALKTTKRGKVTAEEIAILDGIEKEIRVARTKIAHEVEDIEDIVKS